MEELNKYAHQDEFGNTPNWMAWGESTLKARSKVSVRRHVLSSVVPEMENILTEHFVNIAKSCAHGLQIDKLCVGSAIDFNPLNTEKPDVALCEGLIQSVERMLRKCKEVNPDYCIAFEAVQDRFIPFIDVYYRNSALFMISPLKYVFPEWTTCAHIGEPYDFNGVNSAVMTGAVICVEPGAYQQSLGAPIFRKLAEYIKEVERIRCELTDFIFLGDCFDRLGAEISVVEKEDNQQDSATKELEIGGEVMIPGGGGGSSAGPTPGNLHFRVHGDKSSGRKAIVVINPASDAREYAWKFINTEGAKAELYEPFEEIRKVSSGEPLLIKGYGLHVILQNAG